MTHPILARSLVGLAVALAFSPSARAELVARTSLVEMFGAPVCPGCPPARAALEALETEFAREDYVFVEYHTDSGLNSADASARRAYYGDPAIPALFFDGQPGPESGGGTESYGDVVQTHLDEMSPITVNADYFFDDAPGFVNIEVVVAPGEVIEDFADYVIRAVVWEDDVPYCCGDDARAEWNRVVRIVLPAEPITVSVGGEAQTVIYEIEVDPAWRVDQLGALALVQRETDGFVLNAARGIDGGSLNPIPPGPFDPSGITLFQNVPNPARPGTRIEWALERPQWVVLKIFNVQGQIVRVLNDGPRDAGRHGVDWDGTDFRGTRLMSGLYVYELSTSEGSQTKRLTLLRR